MQDKALTPGTLVRLPEVLKVIPVGRSTWWAGVRDGRFPAPVRIPPRITAWRADDLIELLERWQRAGEAQ
jgi:predicted DNA-binding transcriptional regulator AlpA